VAATIDSYDVPPVLDLTDFYSPQAESFTGSRPTDFDFSSAQLAAPLAPPPPPSSEQPVSRGIKRVKIEQASAAGKKGPRRRASLMAGSDVKSESNGSPTADAKSKPKRVRTGCLTCRERHLKCDEGQPNCQNCRKSNRVCKRGLRLNFIDTTVQSPPMIPPTRDWSVQFQDESREIASEYKDGLSKYAPVESPPENLYDFANGMAPPASFMSHQGLPPMQRGSAGPYGDSPHTLDGSRDSQHRRSLSDSGTSFTVMGVPSNASYSNHEQPLSPSSEARDYLNQAEETLFMQVFVEEVGLWMDSIDPHKHVRPSSTPRPLLTGDSFPESSHSRPSTNPCSSTPSSHVELDT
jgi:hypothetical protein